MNLVPMHDGCELLGELWHHLRETFFESADGLSVDLLRCYIYLEHRDEVISAVNGLQRR